MGMSAGGGGAAVKAEPNVTPMIDVMLVLLIIFMIVVPTINAGFNAIYRPSTPVSTPFRRKRKVLPRIRKMKKTTKCSVSIPRAGIT
jgi:biopolymer transport protein ExbD